LTLDFASQIGDLSLKLADFLARSSRVCLRSVRAALGGRNVGNRNRRTQPRKRVTGVAGEGVCLDDGSTAAVFFRGCPGIAPYPAGIARITAADRALVAGRCDLALRNLRSENLQLALQVGGVLACRSGLALRLEHLLLELHARVRHCRFQRRSQLIHAPRRRRLGRFAGHRGSLSCRELRAELFGLRASRTQVAPQLSLVGLGTFNRRKTLLGSGLGFVGLFLQPCNRVSLARGCCTQSVQFAQQLLVVARHLTDRVAQQPLYLSARTLLVAQLLA